MKLWFDPFNLKSANIRDYLTKHYFPYFTLLQIMYFGFKNKNCSKMQNYVKFPHPLQVSLPSINYTYASIIGVHSVFCLINNII